MGHCAACNHPKREEIAAALLAGEPLREIAKRFAGVTRSALQRHRERHTEIPPGEHINHLPLAGVAAARADLRSLDAMKVAKEQERFELQGKRAGVESELRSLEDERSGLVVLGHRQGNADALVKLDSLSERSFKLERSIADFVLLDEAMSKQLLALASQRCDAEAELTKIELSALYSKSEPIAARLAQHLADIETDWRLLDPCLNFVMSIELERISHDGVHPGQHVHFIALRLLLDSLRGVFSRLGLRADINGSSVPRAPGAGSFAEQWSSALAERLTLIRGRRDVLTASDNGDAPIAESVAPPTPAPPAPVAAPLKEEAESKPLPQGDGPRRVYSESWDENGKLVGMEGE